MPDQSWAEGYVVDVDYTQGYYRDLAPPLLRFVTLLGGVRAAQSEADFTYYELGCGHGFSTALHAAANPAGMDLVFCPGQLAIDERSSLRL